MKFNLLPFAFIALLLTACSKKSSPPVISDEKELTSFSFTVAKNNTLPQDIIGEIKGDTIYACSFSGISIAALKASFSSKGTEVMVDNLQQTSGETVQDFTKPVSYTVKAQNGSQKKYTVKFTDTGIPVVYLFTNNVPVDSKDIYVSGYMQIKNNLQGDSLFGGTMQIKGRGNSTWSMPKKPYKIKLDKKAGLLNMNSSKKWVLLANYADKSLIRNEVSFELSRRLQLMYTPASKYVDVILNGTYLGNYQLTEQIDVGTTKINVEEQSAGANTLPAIEGGYLLEADGFAASEPVNFTTLRGFNFTVHYPADDVISNEQKNFISQYLSMVEDSLFSNQFADPVNGYQKYFDLESYINFYLVNEIIGNPDIFWSTYMYKYRGDAKIYSGPVWDFDIAANNDERIGDAVNRLMTDAAHEPKLWINRLMEDKTFRNKVRERWNAIKGSISTINGYVDQLALYLSASQKKNFQAWNILSQKVYLNLQVAGSYEGEITYLKNYLTTRIQFLDAAFNGSRFD